jgi:SAM-dependent methyltransferase
LRTNFPPPKSTERTFLPFRFQTLALIHRVFTNVLQPSWVPPNLKFELDDASIDWTYEDNTFDFIHLRFLIGSIEDWPKLYREVYRCLKPGGWLEHTDFTIRILWDESANVPEDSGFVVWNKMFAEASVKTGRTFFVTDKGQNGEWMKQGGFPGPVNEREFQLPLGTWPAERKWKEVGAFNLLSCEQGLEGYGLYLGTQVLGWSLEEMQVLFAKMRLDMKNRKYHAYYPW